MTTARKSRKTAMTPPEMVAWMRASGVLHARVGELEIWLEPVQAEPVLSDQLPQAPINDEYYAALGGRVPTFATKRAEGI